VRNSILDQTANRNSMPDVKSVGLVLTSSGLAGALATAFLGFFWAPMVDPEAWNAPEAYRILYWHVPFAWASFLSFCLLFVGATSWYLYRSERGWRMVVTGSELGLLFGLGVITSGPIWGLAEWKVPWDWGDLRLNTFALLTSVALFLVLSIRSQPDGEGTRDTLSAVGLFGFALVPITAMATTWFQSSHPGVVIVESDETGLDPQILMVLLLGAASFLVLFAGLVALSTAIQELQEEMEEMQRTLDGGVL